LHIGYIPVKENNKILESDVNRYEIYGKYLNYELGEMEGVMARQKLATLDVFAEQFGAQNVFFGFTRDYIWMSTSEAVQYHIDNFNPTKDFQFGLDIEKQQKVKSALKGNMLQLQSILREKTWEDYTISMSLRIYSNLRPRIFMPTPIMQKSCKSFTREDAKDLEVIMERNNYQVIFLLKSTIWKWDEVLFRRDHKKRLTLFATQ
jgi:hypothetical protein